jgi:phage N-6-adenine-methyltransferase
MVLTLSPEQVAALCSVCPDADLRGQLQRALSFELLLPTGVPKAVWYREVNGQMEPTAVSFYSAEDADRAWARFAAEDLPPLLVEKVAMNTALMFSKASDEWATPQDFFDRLHAEFRFVIDAAASSANAKCAQWWGLDHQLPEHRNALVSWAWPAVPIWLNPPYSKCREFIGRAATAARENGSTVVCLVPSRTDTRWWHEHVWSADVHQPRRYVEVRFIKGRLKFGGAKDCAPFPSVVIVFHGWPQVVE